MGRLLEDDPFFSDDLHLLVAGQLRVLLCDKDVPILLEYARRVGFGALDLGALSSRAQLGRISTRLVFARCLLE